MLNVSMNQLGTVYATKRRRRNGKSIKPPPKDGVAKSNPSKRHRERLNAELDTLASLLPFEQNILSKLDRLSILRLAVSYLRTKSYFQVSMVRDKDDGNEYRRSDLPLAYDHTPLDGEMFLQALNGFLLILTCDGEVFFATHSIESYLGFHQSDIVHQSVYELVHSEDREELQRQLMWNAFCPAELSGISLQETIHTPDHCHFLERSFTVRFRCLLDNTSGFLRLDIRGRIKVLHGQNRKSEDPPLALFALCTPFGPPSLLEVPQKEVMFKSKHKLDLSLVSMDQRGKMLIGYSDTELNTMGGYDLVHFDDLAYVASAHQELLKTGASGLIAYRLQTKEGQWQWLQTSSRLVYKNSKPDFIISTHRPLMEEEGRDLLGKRTMDFKVSYLDAGLTNSYFADQDSNPHTTPTPSTTTATPKTRRYKTQLRDFLASCRSKRKIVAAHQDYPAHHISNHPADPASSALQIHHAAAAAAAAAATYSASTPYNCNVYNNYSHSSDYVPQQNFYHPHPTNFDNRYLENSLFRYQTLGYSYPDYNATPPYNGFIDVGRGCLYDSGAATQCAPDYKANYMANHNQAMDKKLMGGDKEGAGAELKPGDYLAHYTNGSSSADNCQLPRQTVLMWTGTSSTNQSRHNSSSAAASVIQPQYDKKYSLVDPLRSLSEMNSNSSAECKWGSIIKSSLGVISSVDTTTSAPAVVTASISADDHHHHSPVSTSASVAAAKSLYLQGYPEQGSNASELFSISSRYLLPPLHGGVPGVSSGGCCGPHPTTTNLLLASGDSGGGKSDRSPLLSISEVTNTLLNHE